MRSVLAVTTLVGLAACGGPSFRLDSELACRAAYLGYGGGLTYSLLQGEGDGTFDYDPAGKMEERRFGRYNLDTGDFSFRIEYASESYLRKASAAGYGYAATNGDLDLLTTVSPTDALGEDWSYEVRLHRKGCEETQIVGGSSGTVTITVGTYGRDGFSYTRQVVSGDGAVNEVFGLKKPDGSYEETSDYRDGGYTYTSATDGDLDGYSMTRWEEQDTSYASEGTTQRYVDGSVWAKSNYVGDDGSYVQEYTVDYSGDGEGTYTSGSTRCDLIFINNDCTYTCSSGESGSC